MYTARYAICDNPCSVLNPSAVLARKIKLTIPHFKDPTIFLLTYNEEMMSMTFLFVRISYKRTILQMVIERYQTMITNEAQLNSIVV